MFAARYFAPRYFAPRYFPKLGATAILAAFWCAMTGVSALTGGGEMMGETD